MVFCHRVEAPISWSAGIWDKPADFVCGPSAGFRHVAEQVYFAVALPKLDIVAVHQLLGGLLSGFIVRTDKFDCPEQVPIYPNGVRSIFSHFRLLTIGCVSHHVLGGISTPRTELLKRLFGVRLKGEMRTYFTSRPLGCESISYLASLIAIARLT